MGLKPKKKIFRVEKKKETLLLLLDADDIQVLKQEYPEVQITEASTGECTELLERVLSELHLASSTQFYL